MAATSGTLTVKDGNATNQTLEALADGASNLITCGTLDNGKATYRTGANFTPTATGAVTVISIQGSSTKTIRIHKILIGGISTAVAQSIVQLQRTSALGAGGTTVAPVIAKLDTNAAAATAVVQHYTSTLKAAGTGAPASNVITMANLQTGVVTTPATLALGYAQYLWPDAGVQSTQALVLRGTADYIEVQNVTPTNLASGTVLFYTIEWSEDAS